MALTWSSTAKNTGNTALLGLINTGAGTAAFKIYSSTPTLLATLAINSGSVNGTSGQLTLTPGAAETDAPASGTAATAELVNKAGTVLLTGMPVVQGNSPVANTLVISSTEIVQHSTVTLISATVG